MSILLSSLVLKKVRKKDEAPEIGVKNDYEPPYGCWDLNPGPLEEQLVLLTMKSDLQSQQYQS